MGQRVAHACTHVAIEATQHIVGAHGLVDRGAKAREDAGEFDRDIAAADNQQALREHRQVEDLVRADRMFEAGHGGLKRRCGARRHQNEFRADLAPIGEQTHAVGPDHFGSAFHHADTGALEIGAVDARQAGNFLFLGRDEPLPVKNRLLRDRPAEAGRILEIIGEAAGIGVELLGHAAADDAGAADAKLFGDHHPRAIAGGDPPGPDTA